MAGDSQELVDHIESLRADMENIAEVLSAVYDRADEDDDPAEICDQIHEAIYGTLYDLMGLVDRIEEVVE